MRDKNSAHTLCHSCPKLCRPVCPVSDVEQNEATTPWGKMTTMRLLDEKALPLNQENLSLAYKCLGCSASEGACEMKNPVPKTLESYRIQAFQAGLAPDSMMKYSRRFLKEFNPFGIHLGDVLRNHFPKKSKEKRKIIYFPGCTEIAKNPAAVEDTLDLLQEFTDAEIGLPPQPVSCCGYPLYAAGDWDNFVEQAEVMSSTLRDCSLVISGAPSCLYTMETLYREAGHPCTTRFTHLTQYLEHLIPQKIQKKTRSNQPQVAYHDPCYLGRTRGVYEAPRRLIEKVSGQAPLEFQRNRQQSYCCGAGGLLPISSPETARKITQNRIEEFKETRAQVLVTGCPTCVSRFQKVDKGISVKNLADYLKDEIRK